MGWSTRLAQLRSSVRSEPHVHELVLLGSVLALDSADRSSIGAVAPALKDDFHINNADIGALAAAFAVVGVIATVPAGALADRVDRARLLGAACALWSIAMVVVGSANGFTWLFVSRLFLGAMVAAAGPVTASLVGDLFAASERGRALGLIDSGELVGGGLGFLFAAGLVVFVDWRVVYWVLGVPGGLLAYHIWTMREPQRGERNAEAGDVIELTDTERSVREQHVEPKEELVLHGDQSRMPMRKAVWWVLRVPTNMVVIVASSIGAMFLTAVQTFGVLFAVHEYGVTRGQAVILLPIIGVGAFAGTLAGGRLGDQMVQRGWLSGRIWVAIFGYLLACAALLPAILTRSLSTALPLLVVAGGGLGVANPTLDAARLDIVHPQLWGRAESIRSVLRTGFTALAPLLFGFAADAFGLRTAFLIALPALLANALVLIYATRSYPSDVATVAASVDPDMMEPGGGTTDDRPQPRQASR